MAKDMLSEDEKDRRKNIEATGVEEENKRALDLRMRSSISTTSRTEKKKPWFSMTQRKGERETATRGWKHSLHSSSLCSSRSFHSLLSSQAEANHHS